MAISGHSWALQGITGHYTGAPTDSAHCDTGHGPRVSFADDAFPGLRVASPAILVGERPERPILRASWTIAWSPVFPSLPSSPLLPKLNPSGRLHTRSSPNNFPNPSHRTGPPKRKQRRTVSSLIETNQKPSLPTPGSPKLADPSTLTVTIRLSPARQQGIRQAGPPLAPSPGVPGRWFGCRIGPKPCHGEPGSLFLEGHTAPLVFSFSSSRVFTACQVYQPAPDSWASRMRVTTYSWSDGGGPHL